MRPRIPLAATAVALTSLAIGGYVIAAEPDRAEAAPREPTCVAPRRADFPIRTRIHPGPATYRPGGGFRSWSLDLTNTTDAECAGIHPVLVLVDEKRTLAPRQIRLEFSDGTRSHPVRFERTDRDENIGVFDDGFPGFRVGPGETVTVEARLTFTSDARPNTVVANAAVVQRRDDDGEWVGQSGDYRFRLTDAGRTHEDAPTPASPSASPSTDTGTTPNATPTPESLPHHPSRPSSPRELARTGPRPPSPLRGLAAASAALLAVGAVLVAASRRLRTGPR
ncbi:hypothetical protein ACFVTY_33880 [Streptomyces sp. NPDC058067]|uniref:hypothetical protein n=1 Tax=Streptomyces sp. NPDC058067 TaxID=3346324 RepID=UPI0036E762C7